MAVDSSAVLILVENEVDAFSSHGPLVRACKALVNRDWCCDLELTYGEGNKAANWLANLATQGRVDY